jgi:hypothetical protein
MSAHIHTWTDGHLALRLHAYETRGSVEVNPDTSSAARWPRTTGADVVAIAAIVDPAVRANGTPGVLRRWHATLADLERDALGAPHDTYAGNRMFWAAFESVAIYLDDIAVAPPAPEIWDALLDELSTVVEARNAGPTEDGPFAHFDGIKTYDDLWIAQRKYLADKRGSDVLPPPAGFGGAASPVPRTTNADVLQLATYWSDRLAHVKHEMGHDGIVKMWQVALADVDLIAKPGKPDGVYAKNNAFWASSLKVAVQVAISDEAPTKWDMVVSSVKDSVAHLPENLENAASKGADLVASAAHTVGQVANQAGKGLLSGLGAPVLIGAGLIGAYLLARGHKDEEA